MICGIDEAGRGPVIGPMIMAICCCSKGSLSMLKREGVKDSKLLSPKERERLEKIIKQSCKYKIIKLSPKEIDNAVMSKTNNLNLLEADTMVKLIKSSAMRSEKVIIDAPTKNTDKFKILLNEKIGKHSFKLVCENKADKKYTCVAAASILAKVMRDREIEQIKRALGKDIGSGYPADEKTQRFIKKSVGRNYDFIRKSWQTYKNAAAEGINKKLTDFSMRSGFELLENYGFIKVNPKGRYEKWRYEGPATVIMFTTGKVIVQANPKRKAEVEKLLKKLKLK